MKIGDYISCFQVVGHEGFVSRRLRIEREQSKNTCRSDSHETAVGRASNTVVKMQRSSTWTLKVLLLCMGFDFKGQQLAQAHQQQALCQNHPLEVE